jgi:Uma2 family endonuclease
MLWIDEKRGGQAIIGEKGYMEGAPDLVVEVAASSASYDLHEKLMVYQRNGVREYLVWSVFDEQFRGFVCRAEDTSSKRRTPAASLPAGFFRACG